MDGISIYLVMLYIQKIDNIECTSNYVNPVYVNNSSLFFQLEPPDLHQTCILELSRTLLKMLLIDLDLQVHLGIRTDPNRPKSICLHRKLKYRR